MRQVTQGEILEMPVEVVKKADYIIDTFSAGDVCCEKERQALEKNMSRYLRPQINLIEKV